MSVVSARRLGGRLLAFGSLTLVSAYQGGETDKRSAKLAGLQVYGTASEHNHGRVSALGATPID